MKKLVFSLIFLLLVLALAAIGPDTPAEDPSRAAEEAQDPGPQAATEPPEEEPPETFVPSEKLPADSAISFPVDI